MSRNSPATPYSDLIAQQIVARVMAGETVSEICDGANMPDYPELMGWLDTHPEFRERYLNAHRQRANALADEVLQVIRSGEFTASDKQVRIKGLIWAVAQSESRSGDMLPAPDSGRAGNNRLPYGARPLEPRWKPGASKYPKSGMSTPG